MTAKIPATIVTGFLGAGKTTLIRHLLETTRDRRLALVINEFGDVGVDGEILRACGVDNCPDENIVELANGCLCCTVADDFAPAIEALLAHEKRPDHIIIETSGLALPKPLVKAFDWPAICSRLTVDGVVAVVDGRAVAEGRFADDLDAIARERAEDAAVDHDNPLEEVFEDQLACADLVILNKTDLLSETEEAGVLATLRAGAPRATKILRARQGAVDARVSAWPRRRRRGRSRQSPVASRWLGRSRSRRFRQFRHRDRGRGGPRGACRAARGSRSRARCLAHKGLCRNLRQADAPAGAGRRRALPASLRPRLEAERGAREPSRGDRPKGPRPGARRPAARVVVTPCISSPAIFTDSTTRARRSISNRRRRKSFFCRSRTPSLACWRAFTTRTRPRAPACAALRSRN